MQILAFGDGTKIELHSKKSEFLRRPTRKCYDTRYTTKTVKFWGKCPRLSGNDLRKLLKLKSAWIVPNISCCCRNLWEQTCMKAIFLHQWVSYHSLRAINEKYFFCIEWLAILEPWVKLWIKPWQYFSKIHTIPSCGSPNTGNSIYYLWR